MIFCTNSLTIGIKCDTYLLLQSIVVSPSIPGSAGCRHINDVNDSVTGAYPRSTNLSAGVDVLKRFDKPLHRSINKMRDRIPATRS